MANSILSWICHTYRPLTVEELQCALAVSPGLTAFDEDAITPVDTLVSVCGGLVTVDLQSRIIRFVHYTTQEFLEKNRDSRFPTAQADITRTCLTYLSFDHQRYYDDNYKVTLHTIESSPFLTYAAQHWRDHMRASPETDFNEMILRILWQPVKVQCILQAMNDPGLNASDFYKEPNMPPLCAAAILDLESIVVLLLERGADLTESVSRGETALTIAVHFAHLDVIKVLIDRGASVNGVENEGWTPLMRAMTFTIIYTNDKAATATARLLLDRGADINLQGGFDDESKSALMEAADCGYVHLVEMLLTYGANVNLRDFHGSTALHMACPGRPRIFQLLIDHGADPEARDYNGTSPLLAQCGRDPLNVPPTEDTVRLLLESGADIHSRDNDGETALFKAVERGYRRIIQVLMGYGIDINAQDEYGRSVLFIGIEVSLLLELGADVHIQDSEGDTALTLAAAEGKLDQVEPLLDHGANPDTKNEAGDTALTLAADAVTRFEEWRSYDVEVESTHDATLMAVIREKNLSTIELLLKRGASVAVKNKAGDTALALAAATAKLDVVKLLLNHGADPHTKNGAGDTALTLAAAAKTTFMRPSYFSKEENRIVDATLIAATVEENLLILELLLNHGASVAVKNEAGDTALILAAAKGKLDVVKLLLDHGADPHTKNEAGDTALSLSAEKGHSEVHQLLVEHLFECLTLTEDE